MNGVTDKNFGLLIAYLLPGFLILAALSPFSPAVESWLGTGISDSPTVGGFFYATLASVSLGLTASTIRWLVLDSLHHHTGIPKPQWDFSRLPISFAAFQGVVENHYRYYQFYGNTLVAMVIARLLGWSAQNLLGGPHLMDAVTFFGVLLFFVASRDALTKYYGRAATILQRPSTAKELSHDQWLPPRSNHRID